MDESEYECRKQQVNDEEERALELIRAGFRAQRRALDLVWMTSSNHRAGMPVILDTPTAPVATLAPSQPLPPEPAVSHPPPEPDAPSRRPAAELYNQIFDALEQLPEIFDRTHLLPYLHPQPRRSSLHGALREMCRDQVLRKVRSGSGRVPSQYRRLLAPAEAEGPQAS